MEAVFADPQVIARQMQIELPKDESENSVMEIADSASITGSMARELPPRVTPGVACPVRLSATPPSYRSAPPVLGNQTLEVLQQRLGLSDQQTADLIKAGVCHSPKI